MSICPLTQSHPICPFHSDSHHDTHKYECTCECGNIFKALKRMCPPCVKNFAPTQIYDKWKTYSILHYCVNIHMYCSRAEQIYKDFAIIKEVIEIMNLI